MPYQTYGRWRASRVSFANAWRLRPASAGPLRGMVDVGGDALTALGPDLADGCPVSSWPAPPGPAARPSCGP
jgi:hypothetical protein